MWPGFLGRVAGIRAAALLGCVACTTFLPPARAAAQSTTPNPASVTPIAPAATPQPAPANVTPTVLTATPEPTQAVGMSDAYREREDRLALLVGRARNENGLLPLARSPALDRAALAHAQDMAALGYMEHEAPDGSTPGSRASEQGYVTPAGSAWMVVETISAISDQPEGALGWWLGDGLHRRVILRTGWREMGVGYAPGGPYGRFWVGLFGCRPNVLPPVLLDGMLSLPDENCGHAADAFGPVDSARVADTSAAAQTGGWEPYVAQRPWPAGRTALVQLRDSAGHELQIQATDPTGAPVQAP